MPTVPSPQEQTDAFANAVQTAKQQWPRLANWDVALSVGQGPGWSETYPPDEDENPTPGKWHVQLRSPKPLADPTSWPETLALESLHWLQASDPRYRKFTDQFIQSMTPAQHADAHEAYQRGLAEARQQGYDPLSNPHSNMASYDRFLREVQAQEYIRGGGMFPRSIPNWVGPKGEGRYTPEQMKLFQQVATYLRTPDQATEPQAYQLNQLLKSGAVQ